MIEGVRGESEINQVLESLDVSLSNAFAPAQAAELLTGLHAHYKVRLCVICGYTSVFPGYMCVIYEYTCVFPVSSFVHFFLPCPTWAR